MNLPLLQLADSALPIGGYSHSWGLEAAVDWGLVRNALSLEAWVRSWLFEVVGPLEGVVVAGVCRAVQKGDWAAVLEANDLLEASLAPSTLRSASHEMGEQLLALAEAWPWASERATTLRESQDATRWHHAVVFATLAASMAEPEQAVAVYLHQVALGMIGAGVRAIPIGHTHGQQILARLHDDINDLAAELATRNLQTAGSFSPAYEILCHAQTLLYTRLFRS
jgi:urease accessory protein